MDIMTKDPLTVTPTETIGQADDLMNTNRIRQLPVVQEKRSGRHRYRSGCPILSQRLTLGESRDSRASVSFAVQEIMTTEPITGHS